MLRILFLLCAALLLGCSGITPAEWLVHRVVFYGGVTNLAGSGISGATVTVRHLPDCQEGQAERDEVRTSPTGRYRSDLRLLSQPSGCVALTATADGHITETVERKEVPFTTVGTPDSIRVDFRLQPVAP